MAENCEKLPHLTKTLVILGSLFVLSWFNLAIVLTIMEWQLGGTAESGNVVGNHFFVGDHGHYAEVPEKKYWFDYYYNWGSHVALFSSMTAGAIYLFIAKYASNRSHLSQKGSNIEQPE